MRGRAVPRLALALLALICFAGASGAATLTVRRLGGTSQFTAELGEILEMEVVVDAGTEPITGYAFFLSLDPRALRLLPAGEDEEGELRPFAPGTFLGGVTLVNRVEEVDGETLLSYTEAAGGADRRAGTGTGVAARFRLEVVRRPEGSATRLQVVTQGHDRISHYVTADAPGVEKRFAEPPGEAVVRITGFRIRPLPDATLVEGESQVVFDLDAFVDSTAGEVIWSNSYLTEVPTSIDPLTGEVTMRPPAGGVGRWSMIFRAFEANEGLTAADTIAIQILSRPKIDADFPDTLLFAEDTRYPGLDLDGLVEDLDDRPDSLHWNISAGQAVTPALDASSHILTLAAAADFFGAEGFTLVVRDGDGLRDTVAVRVVVAPVNDPPEMKWVPPVYPVQGGRPLRLPLADLAEDRDDELELLQVILDVGEGLRVEIEGTELVIHGEAPGRHLLGIAVQDTSGAVDQGRLVAVVLEAGEAVAPEILRLPEIRLRGGQTGSLKLAEWVRDDSPPDSLGWEAKPDSGLTAQVQQGQLTVGGRSGFAGTGQVRLTVTDPQGNQDQADLAVRLLRPEEGLGPLLFDPGKIGLRAEEGETPIDLDRLVADPDDPDVALTWTIIPSAGLEFDQATRTLRLKAGEELRRPASLLLKVQDPAGGTDEVTVPVLVARPGEGPRMRDFPEVQLDSLEAEVRLDLDEFVFDDQDSESELAWTVEPEPGVSAKIDPVSHLLEVRRLETSGPPPSFTQVLLRVEDTGGGTSSRILKVGLPPLFQLKPLPEIQLVAGQVDTSLVLDAFVAGDLSPAAVRWSAGPAQRVEVGIDPATRRVRLAVKEASFEGSEVIEFTATDQTGRALKGLLRVVVRGKGLTPQVRAFPGARIGVGEEMEFLDLDDYVVDDDPDSLLQWAVSGQQSLKVEVDPRTHAVSLRAGTAVPGVERLQFLVRDLAGNTATGTLEVLVVQGGEPPSIAPLPRLLLRAGEKEKQLDLAPFVSDPDTPTGEITWSVAVEPGMAARIEGSRLVILVPADQQGERTLEVTATDPQGNQMTAIMQILIDEDVTPPVLRLAVERHPVFNELIQVRIQADEGLRELPEVRIDGERAEVAAQADGSYLATFAFPPQAGERQVGIQVRAVDLGGNVAQRQLPVVLSWRDEQGGQVPAPDSQLLLHIPQAASGPGRLAVIYLMEGDDRPPDSGTGPVYAVELVRQRRLAHPVTLNFAVGADADADLGILRWNPSQGVWEEVPAWFDSGTGRLSAAVTELGLFRLGKVAPENRRDSSPLQYYPNPFIPAQAQVVRIVYQLEAPGRISVEIFNGMGQRVRTLVDEFQAEGLWSVLWDGRDEAGMPVGSGGYFIRLSGGGPGLRGRLVLVR